MVKLNLKWRARKENTILYKLTGVHTITPNFIYMNKKNNSLERSWKNQINDSYYPTNLKQMPVTIIKPELENISDKRLMLLIKNDFDIEEITERYKLTKSQLSTIQEILRKNNLTK
jgi:hypothetical protein